MSTGMRGIREGTIEIAGDTYRTRTFTEGAFIGKVGVEVGPNDWMEEAAARQHLAARNADLLSAIAVLVDGLHQGYGLPKPVAARLIGELSQLAAEGKG